MTYEFGWNEKHKRPAEKGENIRHPREVCVCPMCASDPEYSAYYCARTKQPGYIMMLQNNYWKKNDETL